MSVEKFVKGEGPYTFFVDMSDSTASYDFDLYTRVDAPVDSLRKLAALPLQVTWTSPTFHVFREEVYLPMEGKMSLFSPASILPILFIKANQWGLILAVMALSSKSTSRPHMNLVLPMIPAALFQW